MQNWTFWQVRQQISPAHSRIPGSQSLVVMQAILYVVRVRDNVIYALYSRTVACRKRRVSLVTPLFGTGFSAITSLFFGAFRNKKNIFGISEFFYVCLYANFKFSLWSRDHFSAQFRGQYLQNAWSWRLQTTKRHMSGVSAFHRIIGFGKNRFILDVSPVTGRVP